MREILQSHPERYQWKSATLTLVKGGGASLRGTCDDGHLGGRKKQEIGVIDI